MSKEITRPPKSALQCIKCNNYIDIDGLYSDGLCDDCYYKEEEFNEKYGEGFVNIGVTIMFVFLLAVAGLVFLLT